jgi:hypothetical protein
MPSLRATFADDVLLRLAITDEVADDENRVRRLLSDLSDSVVAIVHLAQVAIDTWLAEAAGDVLSIE